MSEAFNVAHAALYQRMTAASRAVRLHHGSEALHDVAAEASIAFAEYARELEKLALAARSRPARRPTVAPIEDAPKPREQVEERTPFSVLAAAEHEDENAPLRPEILELAVLIKNHPLQDVARLLQSRILAARRDAELATFRAVIRYVWHEARNPWEMLKRFLAITRRYLKEEIKGISQTEVAQLLGEVRATPSAREIRIHDSYLLRWNVRAPTAADGALKSPATKAASAAAAEGNRNRKTSARKARAAALLTTFQAPATSPANSSK